MSNDPSAFGKKFREWFDVWGRDLWTLVDSTASSKDSVEELFVEVLEVLRRRFRARSSQLKGTRGASVFVREWTRLEVSRLSLSDPHEWGISEGERFLLVALFRLKWSPSKAAAVFGLSENAVKYRSSQALKRAAAGEKGAQPRGRDCVRVDLRRTEKLLGIAWTDPLKLFSKENYDAHVKSCPRCYQLNEDIQSWIAIHFEPKGSLIPKSAQEFVESEPNLASRWIVLTWISTWPWFVRLPLQFAFAAIVVFAVISVPYIGDFFPEAVRGWPDVKQVVRSWIPKKMPSISLPTAEPVSPPPASVVATTPSVPEVPPVAVSSTASVAPKPIPVAAAPAPAPTSAPAMPKVATVVPPPSPPKEALGPRMFYLWNASSKNFTADSDQILAFLQKYQVGLAGSLALGAQYRGGRYFHFNVSDADYEKLLGEIESLGLIKFSREKSQGIKVRPVGKTRVVFLLKPAGSKSTGVAAPTEKISEESGDSAAPKDHPEDDDQPSSPTE